MFARIHTLETTPDQYERGLQIVRDELLPWAAESSGFRGLIGLTDREHGRTLVLTLWADEAARTRELRGERVRRLPVRAAGHV